MKPVGDVMTTAVLFLNIFDFIFKIKLRKMTNPFKNTENYFISFIFTVFYLYYLYFKPFKY